jgi:hypothetical protein
MISKSRLTLIPVALVFIALASSPSLAGWPANGYPVCEATGYQSYPVIVSNNAGGMIVVWSDDRGLTYSQVYAQQLDGSGNPVWAPDGIPLGEVTLSVHILDIVSDGGNGAIFFWERYGGLFGVQKIDANGVEQWAGNGVPISTSGLFHGGLAVSDGVGGVILVWEEIDGSSKIRAERINANGNGQWSVLVFNSAFDETEPCVVADGSGGAFFAAVYNDHIYAQRIYNNHQQWPADVLVSDWAGGMQRRFPAIAPDGSGGVIVAWQEEFGVSGRDIFARRINAAGIVPWTDPVHVCAATGHQWQPDIIQDGLGNAIICWEDERSSPQNIYAQKLDTFGTPLWTLNGATVSQSGVYDVSRPRLLPGSGSNMIVRFDDDDAIYAQALDATGTRLWSVKTGAVHVIDGISSPCKDVDSDGAGGLVATVMDDRGATYYDIYAQAINSLGNVYAAEPGIGPVSDVPDDQGGWVRFTVSPSDRDAPGVIEEPIARYDVWREIILPAAIAELQGAAAGLEHTPAPAGVTLIEIGQKRFVDAAPGGLIPAGVWERISSFSATQDTAYNVIAPTTADSSAGGSAEENYLVTGHTTNPMVWFVSDPGQGHSVDNIPPHVPTGFSVTYNVDGENRLEWDTSPDPDFKYFRIYRSETPDFTPSPANFVRGTIDWNWADTVAEGWRYHYKISSVDMADNESEAAGGLATGTGGGAVPQHVILDQNIPNPFNPITSITVGLPAAGRVRLSVYDASGRRVRRLLDGAMQQGFRSVEWDGTDDTGQRVSSGVYFYRLDAAGETITRKMLLLK